MKKGGNGNSLKFSLSKLFPISSYILPILRIIILYNSLLLENEVVHENAMFVLLYKFNL